MNVVHVLNRVDDNGNGIVNAVVDLACEQVRSGEDVTVVSGGGGYVPFLEAHGVRTAQVDQRRNGVNVVRAVGGLRRLLVSLRPDVVHAHMNFTTLQCRLALLGTRTSLVATAHTSFKRSASLMTVADRVIAVSEDVASEMRRRGCRRRQLVVVPNGCIGSVRFETPAEPMNLARPSIVMVGGMYERKGVDVLVRAFARVAQDAPDAVLHLVGDGGDRRRFEALVDELGLVERVVFHGFQRDPRPFLLAADVFVLPSRQDPSPLVISEARECGCAIVASSAGGIPQACDWGAAGTLVPPGDVEALAAAIVPLLGDAGLRAEWGQRASADLDRFTVARVASDVDDVYRGLVQLSPS